MIQGIHILSLLAGLLIGGVGLGFYFRLKTKAELSRLNGEIQAENTVLKERVSQREETIAELKGALDKSRCNLDELRSLNTSLEKDITQVKERLKSEEERIRTLQDISARFSDSFKALSLDALKSNNQSFLELATSTLAKFQEAAHGDLDKRGLAINEAINPIKESLHRVDSKLEELERLRQITQTTFSEQMKVLAESNILLRDQTENLVKALRRPIVRGRWGEVQLKRVVELANMVAYCDFIEQESVATDGGRLRPDMIVKLPGNRNIVVDSKVPLEAYLNAVECKDDDTRTNLMKDHARQIRQQITGLSQKGYWQQFERSPEFVVLFLPGETFFNSALEFDPTMVEYAAERNVVLATPMSLIALLRAVAYGWREHEVTKNAEIVAKIGRELHDRVAKVATHFGDIKRGLDKAVEAYNKTASSLESRVLVSVRKFKELGVATSEEIPEVGTVEISPKTLEISSETN